MGLSYKYQHKLVSNRPVLLLQSSASWVNWDTFNSSLPASNSK